MRSPDPRRREEQRHVLAAAGGAPRTPIPAGDPYQALDDLMAVVEALCPVWPPRQVDGPMDDLRL